MARSLCGPSESPRQPEGEVDEADEDGNFDQWPDDAGKAARRTGGRGFPSDSQQTQRGAAEFAQTQRCGSAEPRQAAPRSHPWRAIVPQRLEPAMAMATRQWPARRPADECSGIGCDRHGVVDARGERGRAAGERLYYRSLRRQHPADMAKADGRRARGSRGRLSILLSTRDPSHVFTGDSVTPGRSRKPARAVPSIEGSNPSLSVFCSCKTYGAARPAARVSACTGVPVFLLQRQGPLPPLAQSSRSAEHAQQPRNPSRKPQRAARRLPPVSRSFVTHS